jgi:hypothetical protein
MIPATPSENPVLTGDTGEPGFEPGTGSRHIGGYKSDPLEVPCPFCLAAPGEYCRSVIEPRELAGVHRVRQLEFDAQTAAA